MRAGSRVAIERRIVALRAAIRQADVTLRALRRALSEEEAELATKPAKKKLGRPREANAMTDAEKQQAYRERRRASAAVACAWAERS